jgi:hypothetical protein
MSGIRAFFRHCPSCGRRFEIRLVSKKPIGAAEEFVGEVGPSPPIAVSAAPIRPPTDLTEGGPVMVDVEEFRYTYRCKHCGHEWSEVREKVNEMSAPEGYTGD